MRKTLVIMLGVCLLAVFTGSVSARDINKDLNIQRAWTESEFPELMDRGVRSLQAAAAADTYGVVWYDFEVNNWQGWTRVDNTEQIDTFFIVLDDTALAGLRSLFAMAPPGPWIYMCSWDAPPGYGASWDQYWATNSFPITDQISWTFHGLFDSEDGWDYTRTEYDAGDGEWVAIGEFDVSDGDTTVTHEINLSKIATKLRFHFLSDDNTNDQDGDYDSRWGGCVIDDISIVQGASTTDQENFEGAWGTLVSYHYANSDNNGVYWQGSHADPYGQYSGLWVGLEGLDPCNQNFGTQVVFFVGNDEYSTEYPGLPVTPRCTGAGGIDWPCQSEAAESPYIDLDRYASNYGVPGMGWVQDTDIPSGEIPDLNGYRFIYTVYRDLPLENLVFYSWNFRNIEDGCPMPWAARGFVYYGPDGDYLGPYTEDLSDLVTGDTILLQISCRDMCYAWYGSYGECVDHTPSPWWDNIRVERYPTRGPQYVTRDIDFFQDTFPIDGPTARIDAAIDINPDEDPEIRPGDSLVLRGVTSPMAGGIDTTVDGNPKVYMYVKVTWIGPGTGPEPTCPAIEGDVGICSGVMGDGWSKIQGEWAIGASGAVSDERVMFDLDDELFVSGQLIEYYFEAVDFNGDYAYLPWWTEDGDLSPVYEVTVLPTKTSSILYVDDFEGRGSWDGLVQDYFDPSFIAVIPPDNQPDRYDINGPSSMVGNGLGYHADVDSLAKYYDKIIWDSGNLDVGTICDGATGSGKSLDCYVLDAWLHTEDQQSGLWVIGDDIAYDLASSACPLMTTCGVSLVNRSYFEYTGGLDGAHSVMSPMVYGVPATPFAGDTFYVFGGCPVINTFDVLEPIPPALAGIVYDGDGVNDSCYTVYMDGMAGDKAMRSVWTGSSFMYVRDDVIPGPGVAIDRNVLLEQVIDFFDNETNSDITDSDIPVASRYSLAQNFPNPFNPNTTIRFEMKERAHVTLKVYNVAGQLVKTLVNGVRDVGPNQVTWKGLNNNGSPVASGVYFYKMETTNFSQTKKMIMLR